MDMIKLQGAYGPILFSSFTAVLEDQDPHINYKYLSGHRIEGYFWNRLGIGLSEVVVYGNRFELSYLNPVTIYLINEANVHRGDSRISESGDNVIISADVKLRPADSLELYSEVMVDDGNPALNFRHWDTKFGILGGIYITDPLGLMDTDLHLEYAFLNQYVYTHENPVNIYKHFRSAIGHYIGNDADNLWCELRHRLTDKLEINLTYNLERHGEGHITKLHHKIGDVGIEDTWKPLSGITESVHQTTIGINYVSVGQYSFHAEFSNFWKKNVGNQSGVDKKVKEMRLRTLYRL